MSAHTDSIEEGLISCDLCQEEIYEDDTYRPGADGPFGESDKRYGVDCCPERRVECKFCERGVNAQTAHMHQGEYVGDECCWDERLRSTE